MHDDETYAEAFERLGTDTATHAAAQPATSAPTCATGANSTS
jgi:hypothetical protein